MVDLGLIYSLSNGVSFEDDAEWPIRNEREES